VNLVARGGGKMSGDSSGLRGVGLFASWELDLWGRVRAVARSTEMQYESVKLDAQFARQSIAALVAKGWILAVEARLQKAQAEAMLAASEQLASLARDRLRIGNGDEYDVAVAQANVESLRDAVRSLDLAYRNALRAIEALVGRYPSAAVDVAGRLPAWPGDVPAGLPSELLERRPDVVAAERRVAAAFYRTEEAKAARLPRITLVANFTTLSSEMFVLQNRDNPLFSFGAGLLQPIFLGGLLQSQVDARTAEQQAAIADYGKVGMRVFGEVEGALSAGFAAVEREAILARSVRENTRALELAGVRYRVGSGDLRGVQQQQLVLYSAQVALLRVQAERLVQRVNLHLALGGDFGVRVAGTTDEASPPVARMDAVSGTQSTRSESP
jgi:NodT family efflux transporter outer membrane factor (OMF) lipoprotein